MLRGNIVRAAVIGIILLGGFTGEAELKADLFLTVNGLNPAIAPYTIQETNPVIIAVEGNTPYEPNDITVTAEDGTLSAVPDANYQYYFEFNADSEIATISLTANTNVTIDTRPAPAGTTIYKLYLFYDSDTNTKAAVGIGLEELIASEETDEEQSQPLAPKAIMASNAELSADGVTASEPAIQTDYNLPVIQASGREKYKVTAYCPNGIDAGMVLPFFQQQADSSSFQQASPLEMNMLLGGERELTENVIEINSDITTNQIWTANNVYHITAGISVQAMLVIEPGTIIEFGVCSNYISVKNGGTLISAGTPAQPIIYTCDFLYPDNIGGFYEYILYYGSYYNYAINIEETASPSTTVTYNFIEGAYTGILTNNITLDHPIENNYLVGNFNGITEYGKRHTDVINNMCFSNAIGNIEFYLGDVNGIGDADSVIHITNNTCDASIYGIIIHGVENENEAGWVILNNNIVSDSGTGLTLCDGWIVSTVANTGYFDNGYDKNWDFEEYSPVYEYEMPYVSGGPTIMDICYLRQDCNFIDKGFEYIEQTPVLGKTTNVTGLPDSGIVDLGFHYPAWNYSNAGDGNDVNLSGSDLNGDDIVNFIDFAFFALDWPAVKDIFDLSNLCNDWLKTANIHPPIAVTIDGDLNNLSGNINVSISGRSYNTKEGYIYVDGELMGVIDYTIDEEICEFAPIETQKLSNGYHEIKAVTIDDSGLVTASPKVSVDFNNVLYYITMNDNFEQNENYQISAMSSMPNDFRVKLYDWNDTLAWTSDINSGGIDLQIPAEIFTSEIYDVAIEAYAAGSGWQEIWKDAISKEYDPHGYYKVQIYLPNGPEHPEDSRKKAVAKMVEGARTNGFTCAVWYKCAANWATFSYQIPKTGTEIVYIVTHGGDHVNNSNGQPVNRKLFLLSSPEDSGNEKVFSKKGGLPGNMDNDPSVHSIRELNLGNLGTLRIVYVTACFNANMNEENSEMGNEWLKHGMDSIGQVYISFIGSVGIYDRYHKDWDFEVWNKWFALEQNTWEDVLSYCRIHCDQGSKIESEIGTCGDPATRIN